MAIVSVSRWKGNPQDLSRAREIAPFLKRHGAVSVRIGNCYAGAYAGQIFAAITFPDWASYGRTMQAFAADAEVQRLYAEAGKVFELQERSLLEVEEL